MIDIDFVVEDGVAVPIDGADDGDETHLQQRSGGWWWALNFVVRVF